MPNPVLIFLFGAVQAMSYSDLVEEGQVVGQLGAATQVCGAVGYTVDELVAEHAAGEFSRRARKSGWRDDEIGQALAFGMTKERNALNLDVLDGADTPDALRRYAEGVAEHLQARCREVAERHPGSIRDFEAGDRAMRASLIEALRNLYQAPFTPAEDQR